VYCPECEGEYREGIDSCPSCEVALVPELGSMAGKRTEPTAISGRGAPALWDLVGYVDEKSARDARERLKATKISCELVIRDAFGPDAHGGDEFWIRVAVADAAEAQAALGLEPILKEDACPSCGAPLGPDEDCARCLAEPS